ncbi:MAG: hypothetical protein HQK65_17545 [Desulfamplus sp.]|nr:hypothetical protein [Desulfamplus sp.]
MLYDSTFFGSGDEGFIITKDLILISSREPSNSYDLKGRCDTFYASPSFQKLSDDVKSTLLLLKSKYDEYFAE